ncbi:MAG: restriction endonuclease subunit S [Planctomycetia bacterium]|nr:restriction endonuclease subunit S [Planctomycetia bacterium]
MSWKMLTIGDLVATGAADIQTGPFGTQLKASDYVDDGIPVINVRNIGFGGLKPAKLEFVTEETSERLASHLLEPRDIVFGRKGAVDRHLYVSDEQAHWLQGSDCIRLRLSTEEIVPRFVSYAFLSEAHQKWMLTQAGNKATMASLNHDIIERIALRLPLPAVQEMTVDILSAYDDLIENNRRRMALLEEAARQLYREWFVRLRFPGHEHTRITNDVPEGWDLGTIADFFDTTSGGTPSRANPDFYIGDINWVKTQELNDNFIFGTEERITEDALARSSAKLFPINTLLVSIYGGTNIGRTGILAERAATNQACCALFPKDPRAHYIYGALYFREQRERLIGLAQGAAQTNVSQQVVRALPMLMATPTLMSAFVESLSPIFEQRRTLQQQNDKLRTARDLLLPRLMTGQIVV